MIHLLQTLLIAVTSSHQSADNFAIPATSCDTNPFTFTEISESLVLSHLDSLDPRKSTGPDGLSARFLKEIGYSISYLILLTFIACRVELLLHRQEVFTYTPVHKGAWCCGQSWQLQTMQSLLCLFLLFICFCVFVQ